MFYLRNLDMRNLLKEISCYHNYKYYTRDAGTKIVELMECRKCGKIKLVR